MDEGPKLEMEEQYLLDTDNDLTDDEIVEIFSTVEKIPTEKDNVPNDVTPPPKFETVSKRYATKSKAARAEQEDIASLELSTHYEEPLEKMKKFAPVLEPLCEILKCGEELKNVYWPCRVEDEIMKSMEVFRMFSKMVETMVDEIPQKTTKVCYSLMRPGAQDPILSTRYASGYDIFTCDEIFLPAGKPTKVPTGLRFNLPEDLRATIKGRSSTFLKNISIGEGVIDPDYSGEVMVMALNSGKSFQLAKGSRIAQLVFSTRVKIGLQKISDVANITSRQCSSVRGEKGLGASGSAENLFESK